MALVLSVRTGRSIYIGREIKLTLLSVSRELGRAEFEFDGPVRDAVSVGDPLHVHLELCRALTDEGGRTTTRQTLRRGDTARIGASVSTTVSDVEASGLVQVAIDAPRYMAISRDDTPFDQHIRFCEERETRKPATPRRGK